MHATLCFRPIRIGMVLIFAAALFVQGAALAGPVAKKGFSARERAGLEKLEVESRAKTEAITGRSGDGLINARSLLIVAGLVGIGIWAANSDHEEDECIINGKKIDPNSSECRAAAHLAKHH